MALPAVFLNLFQNLLVQILPHCLALHGVNLLLNPWQNQGDQDGLGLESCFTG